MPLTRPIPPEALPIAEILRRDVARPDPDKAFIAEDGFIRWGLYCPMGMHPCAQSCAPIGVVGFSLASDNASVKAFASWFDEQTDTHAAVEAIWGKE
jgi:hypothetical protein